MSKIIGIVGTRQRDDPHDLFMMTEAFRKVYEPGDWICSGGCPHGGDRFARVLRVSFCTPYLEFPADWKKHGKSAGYVRNVDIAKFSDVLIACVSAERVGGTEHTIKEFLKLHDEENLIVV